ncbi:peptidase T [Ignatzschineria sp. LJL83]
MSLGHALTTRFFKYLAIESQSDAASATIPSTLSQWNMVRLLAEELKAYGLEDIHIDEHSVLTAFRPGTIKNVPTMGFITHVDTVDVGLSPNIYPQVLRYEGKDLCLNSEEDIWFKRAEHPEAERYIGEEIIFSDGTSVLGADNKAAVTCVMELLKELSETNMDCGDLYVAFVPDEEIGLRGAKIMDLDRFKVDFAYTIDCCEEGEVVYETFNAGSAKIKIEGVTAHPMSAKGVLVNPLRVAHDLMDCFDRLDTPEHTEDRDGYFWITALNGTPNDAVMNINIRDFDKASYETRKKHIEESVALIAKMHPSAKITCDITDVYSNIKDSMGEDQTALDLLFASFKALDIEPNVIPMRGGTDGSALSTRGIFTPNYFTGALNFHSRFEFLPISAFEKSYEVTKKIVELVSQYQK